MQAANSAGIHTSQGDDYVTCPKCNRVYSSASPHECAEEPSEMSLAQLKKTRDRTNIFGVPSEELPSLFLPIVRIARFFYAYLAVWLTALFSVIAMALYGAQMLDSAHGLPGKLCFWWFLIFTVLMCCQFVIWVCVFYPARFSRAYFFKVLDSRFGSFLKPKGFYAALGKCQYAMLTCISVEFLFLVVVQHALIDDGHLDQNFGILMGVPALIHLFIYLVRLLAWSQETFEDVFFIDFWGMPYIPKKKKPFYEYEIGFTFHYVAAMYGASDLMMGIFAIAVTYGLTQYTSKTDKVYQFFETFHPCVLIDHYPASLVGLFIIGIREIWGFLFNLMLALFVYLRAGPVEVAWGFGVIAIAQLLCVIIVNAFSAQLYTHADISTTVDNWKGLTQDDLLNVRAHTASYCIWLTGMTILFAYQFRMMYRFNIPFGNGSFLERVFWHVFFVVGTVFCVTMTAAMVIAITTLSMEWTREPTSFLQTIIAFMFNKMWGKYLMLMVAPVQRRMFPPDLGILVRVTADPNRGRFGILGRSENVLSCCFWCLAFLIFGTYLLDDNVDSELTLFPLARGFRIKPAVYVFAPAWFCCCLLLAYAVFLKVHEEAGEGSSPIRILIVKVTGLAMWISSMMCLFMTIPLWAQADNVTIALVICFPLWFGVSQGFTPMSVLFVSSYIILTVLSSVKGVAKELNVIANVILLIQMIAYPCFFPKSNVKLYYHFEVQSQKRVVGHHLQAQKQYEMVPIESAGGYADRDVDYAESKTAGMHPEKKANQEPTTNAAAEQKVAEMS